MKPNKARIVFNPSRAMIIDSVSTGRAGGSEMRNGLYAHFCYDWDEMLIDENDPEFGVCTCGIPNSKT